LQQRSVIDQQKKARKRGSVPGLVLPAFVSSGRKEQIPDTSSLAIQIHSVRQHTQARIFSCTALQILFLVFADLIADHAADHSSADGAARAVGKHATDDCSRACANCRTFVPG
jgi:hypothetical protein